MECIPVGCSYETPAELSSMLSKIDIDKMLEELKKKISDKLGDEKDDDKDQLPN